MNELYEKGIDFDNTNNINEEGGEEDDVEIDL